MSDSTAPIDKKIFELRQKLKEAEAKKSKQRRQERSGQLVALGILLEAKYKALEQSERMKIQGWANDLLEGRHLERALAGFKIIDSQGVDDYE